MGLILIRLLSVGLTPEVINVPKVDPGTDTLKLVLQLVTGFAAAIAFLVIVIAGLRYTLSRGNPEDISTSKDTILYAIAGLLISMAAFSIVTFVVGRL